MSAVSAIPADRCALVVTRRSPREPALERAVGDAWRTITAAQPQLFDGPLLSCVALHVDGRDVRIDAEIVAYRDFVVQRRTPLALGVRPLAVTGVTRADDGVLLGLRSASATQYPGMWEPVPAGSVVPSGEPNALEHQLFAELREELGICRDEVTSVALAGVVTDESAGVVDVCFALSVADAVGRRAVAKHARRDEHTELRLCSPDAARALAADAAAAVPTMAPMLALTRGDGAIGTATTNP